MRSVVFLFLICVLSFVGPAAFSGEPSDSCDDLTTMCDADGNGACDIDDCVYILWYIFMWGQSPTPYALASGDPNCDCQVDIDDVLYGICFIFECGEPACNCSEWQASCGALR